MCVRHIIQNDLIKAIASKTRNATPKSIKENKYYSIIGDETWNCLRNEQCSILIRFGNSNGEVEETVLDFLYMCFEIIFVYMCLEIISL